jgi:hypothetical protein
MPNVTAAAASPNNTCRIPEYHTFFPVNNVIAAPIKNKPTALRPALNIIALKPLVNINGITGIMAPMVNRMNE